MKPFKFFRGTETEVDRVYVNPTLTASTVNYGVSGYTSTFTSTVSEPQIVETTKKSFKDYIIQIANKFKRNIQLIKDDFNSVFNPL